MGRQESGLPKLTPLLHQKPGICNERIVDVKPALLYPVCGAEAIMETALSLLGPLASCLLWDPTRVGSLNGFGPVSSRTKPYYRPEWASDRVEGLSLPNPVGAPSRRTIIPC